MRIAIIAKMGPGTIESKIEPLILSNEIDEILFFRKTKYKQFNKVVYYEYPKILQISVFKALIPIYINIILKRKKVDLIVAYHFIPNCIYAYIINKLSRKPFIYGQTGSLIQSQSKNAPWGFFIRKILKKASYINVPGTVSESFWLEMGIPLWRINILHSTIDTNKFKPDYNVSKTIDFLILSRLSAEKRIDKILDVLCQLKSVDKINFSAVIVGSGPEEPLLHSKISELKLEKFVKMVGFQDNVHPWFLKSKIYLMHSISEGLPTSLMQAMACELIPVVTSVGNIPCLVNEDTGFACPYDNSNDYYKLVKYVYLNHISLSEIAKNARQKIISNHSHESSLYKWNLILKDFVSKSNIFVVKK